MSMTLCVGAGSRRIVEEAAKLRVHQIVASRRQVGEFGVGYTGYTSSTFAETLRKLSCGETRVVRDHGGPYQNGKDDDDWVAAFDADIDAGFDVLHIDVCKLPRDEQEAELVRLCKRYRGKARTEIGGERDEQSWLDGLLAVAMTEVQPVTAVADFGGHIWADRQCGNIMTVDQARGLVHEYASRGVVAKAHNFDWFGGRQKYTGFLCNVAPEFGNVEIDAWLRLLDRDDVDYVLEHAYATEAWRRWFNDDEGTQFERARAAMRYCLNDRELEFVFEWYDDEPVREAIRDAIQRG